MKRLLVIPFTLLLLAGCQTTGKPDNREWTHLACSGASDWTACWRQAEKLCPRGFDIANQQEDRVGLRREVDVACKR
ncbi:MAG TPA: hypothetical protein VFS17_05930 [Methylophilaceae bacterium]|nr:hypothetical protein [Methylophilaceae bacterium]